METVTHPPKHAEHAPADPGHVAPIDPEHEIDAKKTVILLSACLVFVIVCLWALGVVYDLTVRQAQKEKVDDVPPVELQALRSGEDAVLGKTTPAENDGRSVADIEASIRKTTDEVIRRYVDAK